MDTCVMLRKPENKNQIAIFSALDQLRKRSFPLPKLMQLAQTEPEYARLLVREWISQISHHLEIAATEINPADWRKSADVIAELLDVHFQLLGAKGFLEEWLLLTLMRSQGRFIVAFLTRKLVDHTEEFGDEDLLKICTECKTPALVNQARELLGQRAEQQAGVLGAQENDMMSNQTVRAHGQRRPPCSSHSFVCYVHENYDIARKLAESLKALGVKVWIDREQLQPGQRWQQAIRNAIKNGAYFVALFSQESVARDVSYQNEELLLAIEALRQRPADRTWFIPVKVNECEIPDLEIGAGQTLQGIQYVSLFPEWDEAVRKIASVVQASS